MKNRSYQPELLDADDIPTKDLYRNLLELNFINTYLGGHKITLDGVKYFLNTNIRFITDETISIADVGCGGGDNLKAIAQWARKKKFKLQLVGIDIKPDCIAYAQENCKSFPEIKFICSDYQMVETEFDIIFSALFCHHLNDEELVQYLQWCSEHSLVGFFINDLHRYPLAYHSIKYLTQWFSKSYLVKNDAALSVKRGFLSAEWKEYFEKANIEHIKIDWKWAFRHLIVSKKYTSNG